jgi:hypothetical protein
MSFWTAIHQLALQYPEGEPKPIARQFLDRISDDELVDLLADAILTARRHHVRAVEQEAFSPLLPEEEEQVEGFAEHVTPLSKRPPTRLSREQFAELLDKTFAIGDHHGSVVRWGEATVPQHQARIVMLQKQVAGTLETIDRHQQAITLIEEEQVSCLNEALQATVT